MTDDEILDEARTRFKRCVEAEAKNRVLFAEAMKFRALDQWPAALKAKRESDPDGARPCLTIDKLNQYINQVKNDQRQNRPSIKIRPVDDDADPEVAEIIQGLTRNIEDRSSADIAYDVAFESAVGAGWGYFRILTEYADDDGFNQEACIKSIPDTLSVYLDDNRKEPDGSDAQFGFIVESLTVPQYEATYGKLEQGWDEGANDDVKDWVGDKTVRVAEYFYIDKSEKKKIYLYSDPSEGDLVTEEEIEGLDPVKTREVEVKKVKWCKLTGHKIHEKKEFPGQYIPIVLVLGNEMIVDGERVITGLIRAAMDSQRRYNYETSAYVERVALAPKAPYVAADGQIEAFEDQWRNANTSNQAVLTYTPVDVAGHLVPAPQRQASVDVPVGLVQGMQMAEHDIQGTLGMYNASLGEKSNEKSGKAIIARQREGDTATFHYIDNLSRSIRHAGRILVDIIPKIYDTKRIARIIGEDGTPEKVQLDPNAQRPVTQERDMMGKISKIYNLHMGKYDVTVSVGPSYTTKRQEAAESMIGLAQADPTLMQKAGDMIVRNLDWPQAEELADRLKKFLPPNIAVDEEDENSEVNSVKQQAAAMVQQAQQAIQELQGQLAEQTKQVEQIKAQAEIERKASAAHKSISTEASRLAEEKRAFELEQTVAALTKQAEEYKAKEAEKFEQASDALRKQVEQVLAQMKQEPEAQEGPDQATLMLAQMMEQMAQKMDTIAYALANPPSATVKRDKSGKMVGIGDRKVVYDEQGRVKDLA